MQLSEDTPLTQLLVTAYTDNTVWINKIPYDHAIILMPTQVIKWEINHETLTDLELQPLLLTEPELVLIGAHNPKFLSAQQLAFFYEKNIGVELMTIEAACRTYNLLANESRKVVAGLMM